MLHRQSLFVSSSPCVDGDCFYPLRREDAAAFTRSEADAQRPLNVLQLQESPVPEEIKCFLEDVKGDWQCWATPEQQQNNAEGATAATTTAATNKTSRLCIVAGQAELHAVFASSAEAHLLVFSLAAAFAVCGVAGAAAVAALSARHAAVVSLFSAAAAGAAAAAF